MICFICKEELEYEVEEKDVATIPADATYGYIHVSNIQRIETGRRNCPSCGLIYKEVVQDYANLPND